MRARPTSARQQTPHPPRRRKVMRRRRLSIPRLLLLIAITSVGWLGYHQLRSVLTKPQVVLVFGGAA
jgi:hypothetical protein